MQSVKKFAAQGGLVLGICNGFQILCETGLLPGALLRNAGLKYICKQVHLRTETTNSPFTHALKKGEVLKIPIGHMEGNYFCDQETLNILRSEDRIAFRYSTPAGEITPEANPNGSLDNIAGILSEGRNVLGMMPHPDRSSESILGSADGWKIFTSLVESLASARCFFFPRERARPHRCLAAAETEDHFRRKQLLGWRRKATRPSPLHTCLR